MFGLNDLYTAIQYFITIAGELLILFILITFIVGLLMEYVSKETIRNTLSGKRKSLGYFIGAGFGALTPFCSCSTIPILVGLLDAGVPFGTCISFLVASPLLNPVIIGLLLMVIGLKGTVIYIVLTFLGAVIVGFLLERAGLVSDVKEVTIMGMNGGEQIMAAPGDAFPEEDYSPFQAGGQICGRSFHTGRTISAPGRRHRSVHLRLRAGGLRDKRGRFKQPVRHTHRSRYRRAHVHTRGDDHPHQRRPDRERHGRRCGGGADHRRRRA